jgi:hypothetical protein
MPPWRIFGADAGLDNGKSARRPHGQVDLQTAVSETNRYASSSLMTLPPTSVSLKSRP